MKRIIVVLLGLTVLLVFGCQQKVDTQDDLEASNKAVVKRYFEELISKGDLTIADEIIAPEFTGYFSGQQLQGKGPEFVREYFESYRKSFPDNRMVIEDMIAELDKVAVRWRETGTHKGDFMGIAPTNNKLDITGMSFYRVRDGKLVEDRLEWDNYKYLEQLGAVQPLEPGS